MKWLSVPVSDLPVGWSTLATYRPDELECEKGHKMGSEADCILPDDWDYHLCKRCVEDLQQ